MAYRLIHRESLQDWQEVEHSNPLATQMRRAIRKINETLSGLNPNGVAYITGGAGAGKSHAINKASETLKIKPLQIIPNNYQQFAKAFIQADKEGRPLVFNECDHIFHSERSLNILKQVTDTETGRTFTITLPPKKKGQPEQYVTVKAVPQVYVLNSNLLDDSLWSKQMLAHIEPIRSREMPVFIDAEPEAWWEYSVYLALTTDMLRWTPTGATIPLSVQNEAIQWFATNAWRQSHLSPRRLKNIAGKMMADHVAKLESQKKNGPAYDPRALREDLEEFLLPKGETNPKLTTAKAHIPPFAPPIFYTPKVPKPKVVVQPLASAGQPDGAQLASIPPTVVTPEPEAVVVTLEIKEAVAALIEEGLVKWADDGKLVATDQSAALVESEPEEPTEEPKKPSRAPTKAERLVAFTQAKKLSALDAQNTIIPSSISYEDKNGKAKWTEGALKFFDSTFTGSLKLRLFDEAIFATFDKTEDRDAFINKFGGVTHPDATIAKMLTAKRAGRAGIAGHNAEPEIEALRAADGG